MSCCVVNGMLLDGSGEKFVETTTSEAVCQNAVNSGWWDVIDKKLIDWGRDPGQFDGDIEPPSDRVIAKAAEIVKFCRESGRPQPTNVHPDGSGGIVFELIINEVRQVLHVWDDCSVEFMQFTAGSLTERGTVSV